MGESMLTIPLDFYAAYYNIINGGTVYNVHIDFHIKKARIAIYTALRAFI
jgi:hypothetical protein